MTAPAPTARPGRRRGYGERDEAAYRQRTVRGATFWTSRQVHEDLTIVVKRFDVRHEPVGTDRPFVLVHGIGVSSRYFQPLAAELAKRGAVYLVDLPGYGAAPDPRRNVTIADHAAVLASMLSRSGLEGAVLVGHSWGCQVVSTLALANPQVTDRVVLMSPTMQPRARDFWRATGNLLRDALREPPVVFGIAITDYLIRCGVPYLFKQVPYMLEDRIESRLGGLLARGLIVNGDRDPIVPTDWARALSEASDGIEYREVHGPHVIMHTDPVMIAEHIGGWLDAAGEGSP
ncbi:MAG: hydrolase [Schumannella sp.]|jgi:pimeloyl-ACP methyl ester carboxylesterase|nr:hydrolase [Schumannella sp.]